MFPWKLFFCEGLPCATEVRQKAVGLVSALTFFIWKLGQWPRPPCYLVPGVATCKLVQTANGSSVETQTKQF